MNRPQWIVLSVFIFMCLVGMSGLVNNKLTSLHNQLQNKEDQIQFLQRSNSALFVSIEKLGAHNRELESHNRELAEDKAKAEDSLGNAKKQIVNLNAEVLKLQSDLSSQKDKSLKEPEVKAATVSKSSSDKVKKSFTVKATAYGTSRKNGGDGSGRTATGVKPVEGRTIAVDPRVIPLGSRVEITCKSYPEINGVYVAEDRGGAIKGGRIDIYMDDSKRSKMLDFGVRQVHVSVLSK